MKKRFRFRLGQEARAALPDEDGNRWGRSKRARKVRYVFTDWDARERHYVRDKRSWKRKRDKQYHVGGRPPKHVVTLLGDQVRTWLLQRYFEKYEVSYKFTFHREKRISYRWIKEERKPLYNVPVYHYGYDSEGHYVRQHQVGFHTEYYWDTLKKPILKESTYYVTVSYDVIWWSNYLEEADIHKILKSVG